MVFRNFKLNFFPDFFNFQKQWCLEGAWSIFQVLHFRNFESNRFFKLSKSPNISQGSLTFTLRTVAWTVSILIECKMQVQTVEINVLSENLSVQLSK